MNGRSEEDLLAEARRLVDNARFCIAATAAGDGGSINVRVVQTLELDADWKAAFVTSASSRKVNEIRRTGRLTLAYQNDPEMAYVALTGRARVDADLMAKARVWTPGLDRWFADGPSDLDAVVVVLEVDRIELMNLARDVLAEPWGLRAVVLERAVGAGWVRVAAEPVQTMQALTDA
jgi:general stress protein 26